MTEATRMWLRSICFAIAAATLAVTQTAAQPNLATDMKLEDAGFKMREANTPEKMARLNSIPPRKFVPHRKSGQRYYVYADPQCRCAFVGDENAMKTYRDMVAPPGRGFLPGVGDIGRDTGGINLENEMQTEMDDESGTNFDDVFYPGF
ncbi:hypothetical protein [Pseudorhodoplanes sp.]|uniref:hypothetical protein n=1 Tax=Pseudorhodoplanes sp. TaxID=1934341 RepID=UPI002CC2E9C4|nr:hypothetical protein [Pseudorhodoplanes sp.]HWV51023.1 hypothetical protein [Pseudorhodoplanes sp.]